MTLFGDFVIVVVVVLRMCTGSSRDNENKSEFKNKSPL
jgi:hypothetical protein